MNELYKFIYKNMMQSGFRMEIIDNEVCFIHPMLGKAIFPEISDTIVTEIGHLSERLDAGVKLTPKMFQSIIKDVEFEYSKVIGTKSDSGVTVSLREDSQLQLVESLCMAINDRLRQLREDI